MFLFRMISLSGVHLLIWQWNVRIKTTKSGETPYLIMSITLEIRSSHILVFTNEAEANNLSRNPAYCVGIQVWCWPALSHFICIFCQMNRKNSPMQSISWVETWKWQNCTQYSGRHWTSTNYAIMNCSDKWTIWDFSLPFSWFILSAVHVFSRIDNLHNIIKSIQIHIISPTKNSPMYTGSLHTIRAWHRNISQLLLHNDIIFYVWMIGWWVMCIIHTQCWPNVSSQGMLAWGQHWPSSVIFVL